MIEEDSSPNGSTNYDDGFAGPTWARHSFVIVTWKRKSSPNSRLMTP
jgi:hypothetical protein